MTDNHIVTATEPAWTEQQHRPKDNGTPETVPDSLELRLLDNSGFEPEYSCTCGANLRSWLDVEEHFEEVVNDSDSYSNRHRPPKHELPADQQTLNDF